MHEHQVVVIESIIRYADKVIGIGVIEKHGCADADPEDEDGWHAHILMEFFAVLIPDGSNYVEVYELPRLCEPPAGDCVSMGCDLGEGSEAYKMIRNAIVMYDTPGEQPGVEIIINTD